MNTLKGKTVAILFNNNSNEIEATAINVYKQLKEQGLYGVFATSYNQLSTIKRHGYDLLYLFLYDCQTIPTKEQGESIYHLHDVTQADHYWLDHYDSYNLDKAITFFSKAKEELALTQ